MMPEFSFIIPVLNGELTLRQTLESICPQSGEFEIIVVDNNSSDDTAAVCREFESRIQYVFCEEKGRSFARNAGARKAKGTYLVFIDCDVILSTDWLSEVQKFLRRNPVDALATRIVPENTGHLVDRYRFQFARFKGHGTFLSLHKPQGVRPVINTAAAVFKKTVFDRLGGFHPRLRRDEDLEFSTRLFLAGYFIGGTSAAVSTVKFSGPLRPLRYLLREFEVRATSLIREKKRPEFRASFLRECLTGGDLALFLFCLTVCVSGEAGRIYRNYVSRSDLFRDISRGWKVSFSRLQFILSFEDVHPDTQLNFILIDRDVYALDKVFTNRTFLKGAAPTFSTLFRNAPITPEEKEMLLSAKVFLKVC